MEIDITRYFDERENMVAFSDSIANSGREDIGRVTWDNAMGEAEDKPLLTNQEDIETARDWFGEFGAWDDEEREGWTNQEVNALLLQFVAGDLRELEHYEDDCGEIKMDEWKTASESGRCCGNIYSSGEKWYMLVGC